MKLGIKRGLFLGLAVLGLLSQAAAPAGATVQVNAGVLVVTGDGTVSPPLDATLARRSFTFTTATITGVGTVHKQTVTPLDSSSCGAAGSDGIIVPGSKAEVGGGTYPGDTPAFGTGLGFWGCANGPLAGKGGLLYYTRVGPIVTVTLTKHDGTPPAIGKDTPMGALVCGFVPTSVPTSTFVLACVGAAADFLRFPPV
jgi:hypothetical protein